MSLKQFFRSHEFRVNFITSVSIVIGLLIIIFGSLKIYTRHGQENPVPDFKGMTYIRAKRTASEHNLRVKIADSLYEEKALPGSVIDQFPEPGFRVKNNRTILLTINSNAPETVVIPKLKDISFRQAQALIENCGLAMGTVNYKPSEFDNLVLAVSVNTAEIQPGDKLPKGTRLDLTVGKSAGNFQTQVPDLTGLSLAEATEMLTNAMLNVGVVIYDATVLTKEDSVNTLIWKQQPDPRVTTDIDLGSSVDLWVTLDSLKINREINPEIK